MDLEGLEMREVTSESAQPGRIGLTKVTLDLKPAPADGIETITLLLWHREPKEAS